MRGPDQLLPLREQPDPLRTRREHLHPLPCGSLLPQPRHPEMGIRGLLRERNEPLHAVPIGIQLQGGGSESGLQCRGDLPPGGDDVHPLPQGILLPKQADSPIPCALGTYTHITNQESCTDCPVDTLCTAQDRVGVVCSVGHTSLLGMSQCVEKRPTVQVNIMNMNKFIS